jgi:hypothetical protein
VHEFLHLLFEATRRERGWPDYRAHLARSLRNQFLTAAELAWEEHQVHLLTNQAALDLKIATGSDGQRAAHGRCELLARRTGHARPARRATLWECGGGRNRHRTIGGHAHRHPRAEGTETIADVFERVLWRAGLDVHEAPHATDLRFVTMDGRTV